MTSHDQITDVHKLLIRLCRTGTLDVDEAGTIAGRIKGWEKFVLLANSHGIAALARDNLEKSGLLKYLPEKHAGFLRNAMLMSMARNAALCAVFNEVAGILGKEKIKIVALKGMALEHMAYGSRGLRQMSDLDVLISPGEAVTARKILMKSGFASLPVKSVFHKAIMIHIGKHLPSLFRSDHYLEIHHDLFGKNQRYLTKHLMDTAEEIIHEGKPMIVPEPAVFFIYLVKHLDKHEQNNESQLRLYTDLVVLLEKYRERILHKDLIGISEKAGMNEALASRLMILRDFWGEKFPGWLGGFIEEWADPEFAGKFVFFLTSPRGNHSNGTRRTYREVFREMPGFHRKALYVLGELFPTISFMKKRYGCKRALTAVLYYPHRLGKLGWLFRK